MQRHQDEFMLIKYNKLLGYDRTLVVQNLNQDLDLINPRQQQLFQVLADQSLE